MDPKDPEVGTAPIHFIQPGGGFCFSLEIAWGKFRRAILNSFFPAYTGRMRALRLGSCPDCNHNIIDSRDLKLFSNVCGFYFDPDSDPYAGRNRIWFARPGIMELLCFTLLLVPFTIVFIFMALQFHAAFGVGAVAGFLLWLFVISFFRNPPREIPVAPNILVSPADGVITHLEEVEETGIGKAFRVSIFLSVFNVHVNRVPFAGTVTHVRYYPGAFLDARSSDCAKRNEQLWIDLIEKEKGFPVRVKQIAGAIARRIVCQVGVGKFLRRGELYGMIKFGSRTDVLIPANLVEEVLVKVGSAVYGGSTIILKLKD